MPLQFNLREVPLANICGYADQMPIVFPGDWRDEWLVQSVITHGVLTPLLVSATGENEFCIVDGHRRFLAAKAAGMKTAPCGVGPILSLRDYEVIRHELRAPMDNDRYHCLASQQGLAAGDCPTTIGCSPPTSDIVANIVGERAHHN